MHELPLYHRSAVLLHLGKGGDMMTSDPISAVAFVLTLPGDVGVTFSFTLKCVTLNTLKMATSAVSGVVVIRDDAIPFISLHTMTVCGSVYWHFH